MAEVKMATLNVQGFNIPEKRSQILYHMHKNKVRLLCLQETHFKSGHIPDRLGRYFTTWFHSSNPDSRSKGVSIGIHRSLPFSVQAVRVDPNARYLFIRGALLDQVVTVATVYAPNSGQVPFLIATLEELSHFAQGMILLGGDFNIPLHPLLDASTRRSAISYRQLSRLKKQLHSLQLCDVWRLQHPSDRDYTHFSSPHNSYSRLDYVFLSHFHLPRLSSSQVGHMYLSDHAPVYCTVTIPSLTTPRFSWRLNESLLLDTLCLSDLRTAITHFQSDHANDQTSQPIQWEALKSVLRGILISHGSRLKREKAAKLKRLLETLHSLEALHKQTLLESTLRELTKTRHEIRSLLDTSLRQYSQKCASTFYEWGNKPGRQLARALREKRSALFIPSINTSSGSKSFITADILKAFEKYYHDLYNIPTPSIPPHSPLPPLSLHDYIQNTSLPRLSEEDIEALESPFSEEEIAQAISHLPTGKSPGPDGYTARFFKTLKDSLLPILCKTFNSIAPNLGFPTASLSAYITVIPKEGRDPGLCSSYRPISLLNVDLKLFAKLLADRLALVLGPLVHPDQSGFMRSREARDNTVRAFSVINRATTLKKPLLLLSLDAEKAFDRVDWGFLRATLEQIGLGPAMMGRVMALYRDPQARVRVNGSLSSPFPIRNGTRQGCPLSPLLYILCMEHLLTALRSDPGVQGFTLGGSGHLCSAFADDLLLYLASPCTSLPAALSVIRQYSHYSNHRINMSKSVALPIALPIATIEGLKREHPFHWTTESFKYLGVHIPLNPGATFALNFQTLSATLDRDLRKWTTGTFSWLGRANIIKMNFLPRLLYLFQAIPLALPRSYFKKLDQMIRSFIWAGRPSRISSRVLVRRKRAGGLAVPDCQAYYVAATLTRLLDFIHGRGSKQWVALEEYGTATDIALYPWLPSNTFSPRVLESLPRVSRELIVSLDRYLKRSQIMAADGPLTPILGNPSFPPGMMTESFLGHHSPLPIRCFLSGTQLKPYMELVPPHLRTPLSQMQYFQLSHFVTTTGRSLRLARPLLPFEELCVSASPVYKAVSQMYSLLMEEAACEPPKFETAWEEELHTTIARSDWLTAYVMCHKMSISCRAQETNYKILARWYRVPVLLHKFYPTVSDLCWRCGTETGTMSHIWWSCPSLTTFWSTVIDRIALVTGVTYPNDPKGLLLSIIPTSRKSPARLLANMMLMAARSVIPKKWKNCAPPTITDWYTEILFVSRMEELLADSRDRSARYTAIWGPWLHFLNSRLYRED
ncbi:transmembrane protein 260 isoform X1 [Hyla sarda]|uniref:transmembrane protein 260 isoform X1 n=1 Tax=Hyla sarda TaxID=327740 RepID=UPI0024C40F78|nr:transmembrane protein 260 isoform X1 [Hyla sarda]